MKTLHMNKIMAIAQIKTKAFMGKNCIIMPLFALGFTLMMRFLYGNMRSGSASPEFLNGYALSMGLVMNIGMCGIYCTSLLLAATVILNYVLMPISGYLITGKNLVFFSIVTVLSSLISCIIGMLLGIFAKNQVSAGTITTPVLLILMMVPIFSGFVDILEKASGLLFTGILMDMIMDIVSGKSRVLHGGSIVVLAAEAVLAVGLFVVFYRKNGFEKD